MRVIGPKAPLLAAFSDETKTPLATLVAGDGVEEILLAKVRPKNVGEIELCVGQTVEQEVRDAPFAAGADDQIRITDGEARHVGPKRFRRHVVGTNPAGGHGFGELASSVRNLLSASVRQGKGQGHLVVLLAVVPERVEDRPNERRQAAEVSYRVETDAVLEDLVSLVEQKLPQEEHQRVDFLFGPGPVLLAERVERQRPKPETPGGANRSANGDGTLPVTARARFAANLRPPPIAIHDDADVPGQIPGFDE